MSDELRSILLGTAGLSVAALLSLLLTAARGEITANETRLRSAVRLGIVSLGESRALEGLVEGDRRGEPALRRPLKYISGE